MWSLLTVLNIAFCLSIYPFNCGPPSE